MTDGRVDRIRSAIEGKNPTVLAARNPADRQSETVDPRFDAVEFRASKSDPALAAARSRGSHSTPGGNGTTLARYGSAAPIRATYVPLKATWQPDVPISTSICSAPARK